MHHPAAHFHIPVDRGGHIGSVFEYVSREVADAGCVGVRESSASAGRNQWVLCITLPTYPDSISDKPEDGIQLPPSGILGPSSLSFYARGIFKWFQTLLSLWLAGGGIQRPPTNYYVLTCFVISKTRFPWKSVWHLQEETSNDSKLCSFLGWGGGGIKRPTYCDLKMCLVIT